MFLRARCRRCRAVRLDLEEYPDGFEAVCLVCGDRRALTRIPAGFVVAPTPVYNFHDTDGPAVRERRELTVEDRRLLSLHGGSLALTGSHA